MKKFLILLALLTLTPVLFGQAVDVTITSKGPYLDITRGAAWGGTGFGTISNNYIWTPLTPDTGFCVYIRNNNPSNPHSATLSIFITGDQSVTRFTNNTQSWSTAYAPTVPPSGITAIALSSTGYTYVPIKSAARVTMNILGDGTKAGSPDTADVTIVQSVSGCPNNNFGNQVFNPGNTLLPSPMSCSLSGNATVATGTTSVIAGGTANKRIFVCSYQLSSNGTGMTSANVSFQSSTSIGSCTGPTNLWTMTTAAGLPATFALSGSPVFIDTTVGGALCLAVGATTNSISVAVNFEVL